MKKISIYLLVFLFLGYSSAGQEEIQEKGKNKKGKVDLMIGTDATGNMFPGATLPFGGVQLSPDTYNTGCCSGYHYTNKTILGFSHTHLSGTGCPDFGDILIMPTTGEINVDPGTEGNPGSGYRSRFDHKDEMAVPGYYSVLLKDYNIKAELTASSHCGFHKYSFPESNQKNVIIDLEHDITSDDEPKEDCYIRIVNEYEVEGFRHSRGWASDQYVYFTAIFSQPIINHEIYIDDELIDGTEYESKNIQLALSFNKNINEIDIKVGISSVSIEGARNNLKTELGDLSFDQATESAEEIWKKELNKIKIEGGTKEQQTIFYTALYHALLTPNIYSDVDGKYRGMDHEIHENDGFDYYHVFSLWDTYRAVHPFFNIMQPEKNRNFIKTMLKQYEHSGLLPVWELGGCENNCMIGYHSVPVIADALIKGNDEFDKDLAMEAILKSGAQNQKGIDIYRDYQFIPREDVANSVSKTLEYSYDDWCIAQYAKKMGNMEVYKEYIIRSQYYQNHFDSETGLMRPRHGNGKFLEDFDPLMVSMLEVGDYTEANAWHYSFYVPHDIPKHIALVGGDEKYNELLHTFFTLTVDDQDTYSDFVGKFGQYAHGNEPSHHMPYLYNYTGTAWKTQEMVRKTMDELYTIQPDGLCGNDDCGQLSCWYMFSAMGFYPVCPGQDIYVIGSPIFDNVTLELPNGKSLSIIAENNSDKNLYIQSVEINGKDHPYSYIKHDEIINGGEVKFVMGSVPNNEWGSKPEHRPYAEQIEEQYKLRPLGEERVFEPFVSNYTPLFQNELKVELECITTEAEIYYTLDGRDPDNNSNKYETPLIIRESTSLKAVAYKRGMTNSKTTNIEFLHSGMNYTDNSYSIEYENKYSDSYNGGGDNSLFDGVLGTSYYHDGKWQGFHGNDAEVILDLKTEYEINQITAGFLQSSGVWIFHPIEVEFFISQDGKNFSSIGKVDNPLIKHQVKQGIKYITKKTSTKKARYIKVVAKNVGKCPDWHHAAGGKSWVFMDEIIID